MELVCESEKTQWLWVIRNSTAPSAGPQAEFSSWCRNHHFCSATKTLRVDASDLQLYPGCICPAQAQTFLFHYPEAPMSSELFKGHFPQRGALVPERILKHRTFPIPGWDRAVTHECYDSCPAGSWAMLRCWLTAEKYLLGAYFEIAS